MKRGYLSQYFSGVAAKRLSAVEADGNTSHQHEFNGNAALRRLLGEANDEKIRFTTKFLWIGEENEATANDGEVTWYDARASNPKRSEHRLYYSSTEVTNLAKPGDIIFIAKRTDGTLLIIIAAGGTTIESQLLWLFDLPNQMEMDFSLSEISDAVDKELDFTVRFILDELEIELEEPESEVLDHLLIRFKGIFPTTKIFSEFARNSIQIKVDPKDDPDFALISWMNWEEKLFRRLERQLVQKQLRSGFVLEDTEVDVNGFLTFSLSVQNRRKSRVGLALQYHLEEIFKAWDIEFVAGAITENNSKPDFLFPSLEAYSDSTFPAEQLRMLGAKTTCKDRWTQVLAEALRITNKHLITLEPGISQKQTDKMRESNLQLVVPESIHSSYNETQQNWLIDLDDFLTEVSGL